MTSSSLSTPQVASLRNASMHEYQPENSKKCTSSLGNTAKQKKHWTEHFWTITVNLDNRI
jgi:hypothetical protein